MRIVFMGTPDFAVRSLDALVKTGEHEITVITQPDRPRGRGYALTPSDVKRYAIEKELPLYQPFTLKGEVFSVLLERLDPELIVVAAYGKILPKSVLEYPKYGCINVHGSLLPKYRGAAPIQRALLNGETETGVTIMKMDEGLDTGDMLLKRVVPIAFDDDLGTLWDKVAAAGAEALLEAVPALTSGRVIPEKQNDAEATYAPKLEKADTVLSFKEPADRVRNRIRALSPQPLAGTERNGQPLKIAAALPTDRRENAAPGALIAESGRLFAVCGEGTCLEITEVLPAGKKRMKTADYLRGHPVKPGERLGSASE